MGEHLVLPTGLGPLLLPSLHALSLPVEHLLVQIVQFVSRLFAVFLLLLLLQLFKELLVGFKLEIGDHFVLHARLKLVLLLTGDHADLLLHLLVLLSSLFLHLLDVHLVLCLHLYVLLLRYQLLSVVLYLLLHVLLLLHQC